MKLSAYDFALFSTYAYEAYEGQQNVADQNHFNNATIIDTAENRDTGFFGVAFETNDTIVISYEGTNFEEQLGQDAVNGWLGGAGLWYSPQSVEAIKFFDEIQQFSNKEIVLTGHSLGGGLAGLVANLKGVNAVVFDPMPFRDASEKASALADIAASLLQKNMSIEETLSGLSPQEQSEIIDALTLDAELEKILRDGRFDASVHPVASDINADVLGFIANLFLRFGSDVVEDYLFAISSSFITNAANEFEIEFGNLFRMTLEIIDKYNVVDSTSREASFVSSHFVSGEVLELVRSVVAEDSTDRGAIQSYDGFFGGTELNSFLDLYAEQFGAGRAYRTLTDEAIKAHSIDLLSLHLFLEDRPSIYSSGKHSILGGSLYNALFDEEIAASIGFETAADMAREIALSGASLRNVPTGGSAIPSLFGDANNVGLLYNGDGSTTEAVGASFIEAIGGAIVQYSGLLAKHFNANPDMANGFIRKDELESLFTFDLSNELWATAANRDTYDSSSIFGRDAIINQFGYDAYFSALSLPGRVNRSWLSDNFEANDESLLARAHIVVEGQGGIEVDLGLVDRAYQPNGTSIPSNDTIDILATTDADDRVVSSARNELIDLKDGNDTLVVYGDNAGHDLHRGGGDYDTVVLRYDYDEYQKIFANISSLQKDIALNHSSDGSNTFIGFERFEFADAIYELRDPVFGIEELVWLEDKDVDGAASDGNDDDDAGGDPDLGSGNDDDVSDNPNSGGGSNTDGDDGGSNSGTGNDGGSSNGGGIAGEGDDGNSSAGVVYGLDIVFPDGSGAVTEPQSGSVTVNVFVTRQGNNLPEETLFVSTVPGDSNGLYNPASASQGDYLGKIGSTESVVNFAPGQESGLASFTVYQDGQIEGIEAFRLMLRDDQVNTTSDPLFIQDVFIRDNATQTPPDDGSSDGNTGNEQGPDDGDTDTVGGSNDDPSVGFANGVEIRIVGLDRSNPTPGGSAAVEIEVENTTSTSKLVGTLGIYFSDDENPSRSDLVGTYSPGVVEPGVTEDRRVNFIIPDDASGTAKIIVVDEDDRNNAEQAAVADFSLNAAGNRADLTIQAHHLSDNTLVFGQSVDVVYDVANIGFADSGRSNVALYLSTNRSFSEDRDVFIADDFFGSNRNGVKRGIDAGDRDGEVENVTITADMVERVRGDLNPTNLYLLYVIDEDREIDDADRDNNVSSTRFTIAASEEDVVGYTDHSATDFSISTDRITYGERFYFSAVIENSGSIDTDYPVQYANLIWRSIDDGTEYVLGSLYTNDSGVVDSQFERNTEYFATNSRVISESSLSAGGYDVFVRTQDDDSEALDRLGNNESNTIRVYVGADGEVDLLGVPDPALRDLVVSQTSLGTIAVSFGVRNLGQSAYQDAIIVTVAAISPVDQSRVDLGEFVVSGLAESGASNEADVFSLKSTELTLPSTLAPGTYDVEVRLRDVVGNASTQNDVLVAAASLKVADVPSAVISLRALEPSSVREGSGSHRYVVETDEPTQETVTVNYRVLPIQDDGLTIADFGFAGYPQGSVVIPAGQTFGAFSVAAVEDFTFEQLEQFSVSIEIDASSDGVAIVGDTGSVVSSIIDSRFAPPPDQTAKRDIAAIGLDFDINGEYVRPGDEISIDVTARNAGNVTVDRWDFAFVLSEDQIVDPSEIISPILDGSLIPLPGANVLRRETIVIPENTPDGFYYLGATLDPEDVIKDEASEQNNSILRPIVVRSDKRTLLVDDFNDGFLAGSPWLYEHDVSESGGVLRVSQSITDRYSNAMYKFDAPIEDFELVADRYYYAANNNFFGQNAFTLIGVNGQQINLRFDMLRSTYGPDYENNPANFDSPRIVLSEEQTDGSFLGGYSFATDVVTSDFFDRWLTSSVALDSDLGRFTVDLDSDGNLEIDVVDPALVGAAVVDMSFFGYGWFTGHYTLLDNLTVSGTKVVDLLPAPVNQAPAAIDDFLTTDEDTQITFNVVVGTNGASADSDPDGNPLKVVAIRDVDGTQLAIGQAVELGGRGGVLTISEDGNVWFDPAGDFEGYGNNEYATKTFEYDVSDGDLVDTGTIGIRIYGSNDAPTAEPGEGTTEEDTTLEFDLSTLASDDDLKSASFSLIQAASNGAAVVFPDGRLLYTPNGDFNGSDSFVFGVTDYYGAQAEALFELNVVAVNDAPTLPGLFTPSVPENATEVLSLEANDIDGDALTYRIVDGQDASLFELDTETGRLSFKNAPDFEAPSDAQGDNVYSVEVSASDGEFEAVSQVLVDVTDVEEAVAPIIVSGGPSGQIIGSDADEIIQPNAGTMKTVLGGGGADTFDFSDTVHNGAREFRTVLDYEAGDAIDLGDGVIVHHVPGNNLVQLFIDQDFDVITVVGTTSLSDIEFV